MIREFYLGAAKWEVEEVKEIDHTGLGLCSSIQTKISIAKNCRNLKVSQEAKEEALYHEVVHAMFETVGRIDLSHDEVLVQSLSVLMRQFEKTKK